MHKDPFQREKALETCILVMCRAEWPCEGVEVHLMLNGAQNAYAEDESVPRRIPLLFLSLLSFHY